MKFTISREALLRPLQVVSGVVEKRQTLPILSNVLLQVEPERLTLTGTDLEVELRATAPLVDAEEGEITLPARKFMDICRTLPEEAQIELRSSGERITLRSGKSRFTLSTLSANEFPLTDSISGTMEFELPQGELKQLLERTQFCMANQDVRYYLNGLLLELNNGRIRTVATDGHRLALAELNGELAVAEERQVIVPRKGVGELTRLLEVSDEPCRVAVSNNHIQVIVGDVILVSKLIDGRFPDYDRVIPSGGDKRVVAERDALRQALIRTSIVSNEKYRGIRIQLESNQLRATVHNPEQEEAEEEVAVEYDGEPFEIGFNVAYLLEALNAVRQDEVELRLTDANSSCLVNGVGDAMAKYVVMPMRL